MTVIDQEIKDLIESEGITWIPLHTAHKDRSSEISVSSDYKYLRKTKGRKGSKRDTEFYNLAFWNELFGSYSRKTGSNIYVPKP